MKLDYLFSYKWGDNDEFICVMYNAEDVPECCKQEAKRTFHNYDEKYFMFLIDHDGKDILRTHLLYRTEDPDDGELEWDCDLTEEMVNEALKYKGDD